MSAAAAGDGSPAAGAGAPSLGIGCADCEFCDAHRPDCRLLLLTLATAMCAGGPYLPPDVILNTTGLLGIAAMCDECRICDVCNPEYAAWLARHTKGRKAGSCRQGTHEYPCHADGTRPCDPDAVCVCVCPANPKFARCGLMRTGARRGGTRTGGSHQAQAAEDARTSGLRDIHYVRTDEDGACVDDGLLPDFTDIAALVSDRVSETLKHCGIAGARSGLPSALDEDTRERVTNLLRDTCFAVVRSACGQDADTAQWTAWCHEVARAMDDEWFSAERDDADLARSLLKAMQIAYESQPQRSVVRNVILGLLRVLKGTVHHEGQQPRRIVQGAVERAAEQSYQLTRGNMTSASARASGSLSSAWNVTEQNWTHASVYAAVMTGGRVPASLPQQKLAGSELCLMAFCAWCRDSAFATRPWLFNKTVGADGAEYNSAKQMLVGRVSELYPEFCEFARRYGVPETEIFSPSTFRRLLDDNSHGRLKQRGCLDTLWLEHVRKFWIRLADWCRHLNATGVLVGDAYTDICGLIKDGNAHYGRMHRQCYNVDAFVRAPPGEPDPPFDPFRCDFVRISERHKIYGVLI